MLVLDTSVLVEHLHGNERVRRFLETEARRGPLLVPSLAAWELWKGAGSARDREAVDTLLAALETDPFHASMARIAGDLHRGAQAKGRTRAAFDLLIASHALYHGCPLATADRDYDSVEGVTVIRAPR
ncbi:MAG: type II toxin-antitoxin system VapC family toxin [Methanobacteriota archaeon]